MPRDFFLQASMNRYKVKNADEYEPWQVIYTVSIDISPARGGPRVFQ